MVQNSSGKSGYKSYRIVDMRRSNGCQTKFNKDARYVARGPAAAARKALTKHCAVKDIHGRCTLYIKVKETTHKSKGKTHTYLLHRKKLHDPIVRFAGTPKEFKFHYETEYKSVKGMPTRCRQKGRHKSRGRMRSLRRRH